MATEYNDLKQKKIIGVKSALTEAQLRIDNLKRLEQKYAAMAPNGPDHIKVKNQIVEAERALISLKGQMPVEDVPAPQTTPATDNPYDKLISESTTKTQQRVGEVSDTYEKAKAATAFNTASKAGFMAGGEKGTPTQVLVQNAAKVNDDIASKVSTLDQAKQKDLAALEAQDLSLKGNLVQAKSNAEIQDKSRLTTEAYNNRLLTIQEQSAKDTAAYNQKLLEQNAANKVISSGGGTKSTATTGASPSNPASKPTTTEITAKSDLTMSWKGPNGEPVYRDKIKDGQGNYRYFYYNAANKIVYVKPPVVSVPNKLPKTGV